MSDPRIAKIAATLNAAAAAASITIKAQQETIEALLDALGGSDG